MTMIRTYLDSETCSLWRDLLFMAVSDKGFSPSHSEISWSFFTSPSVTPSLPLCSLSSGFPPSLLHLYYPASLFISVSQSILFFCPSLLPPPLSLIISIGCCPNSTHPEKMKPAILKLIPENSPQAAAGWVEWGLSETWGCTFYIINQNKTFSLQKTKEKKIYIYIDQNK